MRLILSISVFAFTFAGCAVALKAPEKPLEINMNVKIDHQISVKVDKQLDDVIKNNEGIF
jgi:hypothetical protein